MDAIAEWNAAQRRVRDLTAGLDAEQAAITVPACPAWTVRDLLSHMVGIDADILAGQEPGDDASAWTQAQVDQRAGATIADLLTEWDELAGPLSEWMRANNTRPLGDVIIHEQDLRGALKVPGARDTDGWYALRDRVAGGFGQAVGDLPAIALIGPGWQWASSGTPDEAVVVVRADDYDLGRAVMTRRSEEQLRSWTERGQIGNYLDAFAQLGPLPTNDLFE